MALMIERKYTKSEIMELYLNQIYMGEGAYGVEAAARTYFGKEVKNLTLAESALVAALPRAPSYYSPWKHPDRAMKRMKLVIRRMVEVGFITQEEADRALSKPLDLVLRRDRLNLAPYFSEYVRQYLEEQYGAKAIYQEGLDVYSTLDYDLQVSAQKALREGLRVLDKRRGFRPEGVKASDSLETSSSDLKVGDIIKAQITRVSQNSIDLEINRLPGKIPADGLSWAKLGDPVKHFAPGEKILTRIRDIVNDNGSRKLILTLEQEPEVEGALMAIEPQTGFIKAMVGGYSFNKSKFNRATQALRQPGSSFKPFIYTTAIDMGTSPMDVLFDAPLVYEDPVTHVKWKPRNFSNEFHGPVTLQRALEMSYNAATIRLAEKVGIEKVISYAQRLGITSPLKPYLSLALGTSEVTLLEMVAAYGTLANQGIRADPVFINQIKDNRGLILEENRPRLSPALSPQTAYVAAHMLKGVIERGTGRGAKVLAKPLAGKTGTTDDYGDAWFIGFSPTLATGVWVGMDVRTTLGRLETGARAALPIWIDFMKAALEEKEVQDFPMPDKVKLLDVNPETGLLSGPECPNTITVAFIEGTEPKTQCTARSAAFMKESQVKEE